MIDIIRVPLTLLLVFFYQLDVLNYWHIIIVSFIMQCLGCFFNSAHWAILPAITKEERPAVNSLLDTVTRGAGVSGPVVSLGLMNTIGVIHFFTFAPYNHLLHYFNGNILIY